MITIILTYRNRELHIVKKCLDSLQGQTSTNFVVELVDYGSNEFYSKELKKLLKNYSFIELVYCSVEKQLWNKSKAINIALKQSITPYFFVGDIDMIYRNDFVEKLDELKKEKEITYFQVGFLTKEESSKNKPFEEYNLKHISGKEATGMSLYPTQILKNINGYDEFYHGWGSEDTDVHIRLKNAGFKVEFYTEDILILHQWHSRTYRSKESKEPFHTSLEQINQGYFQQVIESNRVLANENFSWGKQMEVTSFKSANSATLTITNLKSEIDALVIGILNDHKGRNLVINVKRHQEYRSVKNNLKRMLGKKYFKCYHFQTVNNIILATVIANYRNNYYEYEWDKGLQSITLKIVL